jgi:hypothetical protein
MAYTEEELALRIKEKYPQYQGVDNSELISKVLDKYPEYRESLAADADGVEQVDVDELYTQAGGVEREPYITEVPYPEQAERKLKLYDEDLTFVQNVDQAAFDIANQFNNQMANMAGSALNALGAGITKVASKITGKDYEYTEDWKETFRDTMNLLPGQVVLDEEPRTPYGYVGQTGAEAATFLIPQIKGAQILAATQAGARGTKLLRGTQALSAARLGSKGTKLLREVSEQFVNEAAQNTGRLLAIEAGAAVGAGAGRAVGEVYDLSPGGRFATELLSGIVGGFGGAGLSNVPKSLLKKTEGKTATEVLEMVSDGTIEYQELQWMPMIKEAPEATPAPKTPTPGIVKETVEFNAAKAEVADKIVQRKAIDTANASKRIETYKTSTNPIMRATINLISALSPSTIAGKDIVFNIDDARNMVRAAEKTGAIVRRKVDKLIKKDPDTEKKVNAFLDGGEMDPSLEPIRNELEKFRDTLEPLQKLLIENLDDETIQSLPQATREDLISTIKNSIEEKSYVSREYRMFTDRKYQPSVAQRAKAEQEIATGIMMSSEAGTMTMDRALEMAKNQLDDLESKSARVRLARSGGHVPRAFDGVLKSKRKIGPEERKYLGEIVEPGEKIFGTLSRVSRLVAAQNQDIAINRTMLETGLASRGRRTPTQVEVPLSTTKGASGIYAEPEIVSAVTRLRMGDTVEKSNQPVARVLGELYNSLVGFSKATKVVLSPIAYPVQVYGNIAAALSSGIMPTGDVIRGMKLALSEFGPLRDILGGKDTASSRAFLDDIEKMAQYGLNTQGVLASDVRDSFKRSISQKGSDLFLEVPSKLYSAPDIAFRYVVWKGNQKQLRKMYPDATQEQIEAAAARLTNDTYQQYDKVSGAVKYLSRVGLANPFVTFTAEKLRNMYNQGRYATKMLNGTFGRDIGLDPSTADIAAMRLQGGKRAASLAAVAGGSAYVFNEINQSQGLGMEAQKEFGETIAPNWDSKKQLVIIPDASGRKGVYFNPSYLVPELTGTNAFYAGLRNKDFGSVIEYLTEELMGEGTFVFQAAAKIVLGFDENGKEVSLSADKLQQLKDKAKVFWEDVLEPGGMREIDKWERALQDVGDVDEQQLLMRLMGFRYNAWDAERSGKLKMRSANNAMRDASGRFSSARDYKDLTPSQLEAVYEEMNAARRSQFDVIRQHYENLGGGTWKYTEDERIQMMKDAGMSGSDILDVVDGTYTDMPRTKKLRTSEIYDEIPGTTTKEKLDAMKGIRKSDPGLYKRLVQHHKRLKSIESRNLSGREKLIAGLDVDKRVDYLLSVGADKNRALMREYQRKGIATKSVLEAIAIKQRGY